MIKGVTHAHLGPIWYHSEPLDIPYSPNQFLGWDFFATSYSKMALAFHDNLFDMLNYFIANKDSL